MCCSWLFQARVCNEKREQRVEVDRVIARLCLQKRIGSRHRVFEDFFLLSLIFLYLFIGNELSQFLALFCLLRFGPWLLKWLGLVRFVSEIFALSEFLALADINLFLYNLRLDSKM